MALSKTSTSKTKAGAKDEQNELVEFEPKDDDDSNEATATNCDTEAITKEEEWITKRKTELTTTRQIETRVKRQVKLQDGKVIEDSGPIVSTNTTEDTDKQETETTEKRDLGLPDELDGNAQLIDAAALEASAVNETQLAQLQEAFNLGVGNNNNPTATDGSCGKLVRRMVPRPVDGLVRQVDDKRVISHEEIKDYHETQDVKHLGDFTDETYVKAVREGVQDLEAVLCSPESQQQLVALGPQVVANTSKSRKTIDSEDTQKRCLAQEDGTLVTESKKTTEHELILDGDEEARPDDELLLLGDQLITTAASQRYFKQRDEQHVDLIANGKVVATEMRYAAETQQIEKDGSLERPGDWDSLSDRMRKLRRTQQQQQQKEVALLADRKDALTKRPLDFDREEETRKGETMKWLESHFGSESTASNDSRDDIEANDVDVEPTKKSYFNVTIKSQSQHIVGNPNGNLTQTLPRSAERERAVNSRGKYFQGISNWAERQETPVNHHFSTQAFREDLQETIRRNGLKKKKLDVVTTATGAAGIATTTAAAAAAAAGGGGGGGGGAPNDSYVSREDILQQKRQSLSSQFLARSTRGSRDALNDLDAIPGPGLGPARAVLGYPRAIEEPSHKRIAYGHAHGHGRSSSNPTHPTHPTHPNHQINGRGHQSYETPSSSSNSNLGGRPTVPQRRRAIEKKLGEHGHVHVHAKVSQLEPPPDYSPPPRSRSRSSSPQVDYVVNRARQPVAAGLGAAGAGSVGLGAGGTGGTAVGQPLDANTATMTLNRKQQQRTRFAPTSSYPPAAAINGGTLRPGHTSASTSNLSTMSASKPSKMGQVIGNSLRKLVSKIRSASVERKFRMKSSANKSREQSPSPAPVPTTYQQYNVIDGHIGGAANGHGNGLRHSSNESEGSISDGQRRRNLEVQSTPAAQSAQPLRGFKDAQQPLEQSISPRQRYYLGEDPYSSTLYGKENIYERHAQSQGRLRQQQRYEHPREPEDEDDYYESRAPVPAAGAHTLGRYQKHGQRFSGSTPNLNAQQDYRSAQTLPRKLHEGQYRGHQQQQQQRYNQTLEKTPRPLYGVALNSSQSQSQNQQQRQLNQSINLNMEPAQGPAKPARTYAKVLNRSKSFNVHGMNGSNDPSPIYIEKLTRNNYNNRQTTEQTQAYKSNPHLFSSGKDNSLKSGLKSPSIVNLISRSQKDLTKIVGNEEEDLYQNQQDQDKKQLYLRGLHQQAPDLYRVIHGDEDYARSGNAANIMHHHKYPLQAKFSLDSRSPPPVELNKDTASIVRRSSASNESHNDSHKRLLYTEHPQHPQHLQHPQHPQHHQLRRGSGATIIELRNRK
ncbi:hypothetical protein ACLKA6_015054 [Drosophila palustris]